MLTGFIIPCLHSLIRIHSDIILAIDNLQTTLPGITCILRLVIFWWKKQALIPVVNMMVEDWKKSKNQTYERETMIRWALRARIVIICIYSIMGMAYILFVGMPIFGKAIRLTPNITDPGRPLPLQTYYLYDVTKRPQHELTFIFQAISTFIAMLCYTGIDTFLGLLTFHICAQLDILKNRLMHLHECESFHDALKDVVMYHIRLLRMIFAVEDAYNIILLVLLSYFAILFAFYGFLLISLFDEGNGIPITRLLYLVIIVITVLLHMCLYCAVGEMLMTQCDGIYYAICNYKWYSLDPKKARHMIIFMIKASEPVYLTAGKVFPMTLSLFCNVIKTSAGYMSFLLTTRN
nr:PREDICTED: odorant receptor 9a-like [Linepithema humile]